MSEDTQEHELTSSEVNINFEPLPDLKDPNSDRLALLEDVVLVNGIGVTIPVPNKDTDLYLTARLAQDSTLVGFVELQQRQKGVFEIYAAVKPDFQKQKIWSKLFLTAIKEAPDKGISTVESSVNPKTPMGQGWEKLFSEKGESLSMKKTVDNDRVIYDLPVNNNTYTQMKEWYKL